MPDAIITSTASTFGTITGTFAADQSTVTGTVTGIITGTLSGSVGVPGPKGDTGPQGPQGEPGEGVPAGGLEGQILLKASDASYDTVWADNSAETLTATVRNETGATLSKGTVVYITGAAGNKALVSKASASSEATSSKTFAILAQDILNNQNGTAVTVGLLKGLNTSALTEGGSLWLSTIPGQWTQVMPTAPNHAVFLGTVTRVHANQGTVEVRIQNGYELQELHNVKFTDLSNGQVLKYDAAQQLWVNGSDLNSVAWGQITGTLSSQTDLQSALDGKYSVTNPAGYITSSALIGYATQSWVTSQGYLTSSALAGYATESWVTSQGYITSSALTPYLTKADNLGSLTNFATARDNLGLGSLSSPTFAGVTVQGSGANVAQLGATFLTLNHTGYGQFTIQPSTGITFPDASVQSTAFPGFAGYATESWVTSQGYLTDAPSDGNQYARKDGAWDIVSAPAGYITSVSSPLNVSSGDLSIDLTGYATESWVQSQGYLTSVPPPSLVGLTSDISWDTNSNTGRLLIDGVVESGTGGFYSARLNFGSSVPNQPEDGDLWRDGTKFKYNASMAGLQTFATESFVTGQGYITSSALTGYATQSWVTSQGYLTTAPVTSVAGKTGAVTLTNTDISGLGTLATVNDAPSDGNEYVRKNAAWAVATGGGGGSGGVDVQTFGSPTSSGTFTWTKPAGAKYIEVHMWGSGGGGGSGAVYATTSVRTGGAGGGCGGYLFYRLHADTVPSTVTVRVGQGKTGGAARSGSDGNGNAGGSSGTVTNTDFHIYRIGGGSSGAGGSTASSTGGTGGTSRPYASEGFALAGGGCTTAGVGANASNAVYVWGNTGGGGGSGAAASSTTNRIGGNGGNIQQGAGTFPGAINNYAGGSGGTIAGVAPTTGVQVDGGNVLLGATGGGGGAYVTGANGQNGAVGAWPGGGGGGGAAADSGFSSGAGGNGANGRIVVITYF